MGLEGLWVYLARGNSGAERQCGGGAGGLADATDGWHGSAGGLGGVIGRDATAGYQEVFGVFGQKRAIRDGIIFPRAKIIERRAGAFRVMDIDLVVAGGDGILKFNTVFTILLSEGIFSDDAAAFPHTDLRGGHHKEAVFKAVGVLFQKIVDLVHLAAGKKLGLCYVEGVYGVLFYHTGGIKMQDGGNWRWENEDVFPRIHQLAFGQGLCVGGLPAWTGGEKAFRIHVAEAEAQGHGLAKAIGLPAEGGGEAGQGGQ